MSETEITKKVTNEQLLEDIKNTEIEINAYKQLKSAYAVLSKFPENSKLDAKKFLMLSEKYCRIEIECSQFLEELWKLKLERGLK